MGESSAQLHQNISNAAVRWLLRKLDVSLIYYKSGTEVRILEVEMVFRLVPTENTFQVVDWVSVMNVALVWIWVFSVSLKGVV